MSDHPLWRVDRVIATPRRPWRALRLLEEPLMNRFGTFALRTQHDAYVTEGLRDPSIDYE